MSSLGFIGFIFRGRTAAADVATWHDVMAPALKDPEFKLTSMTFVVTRAELESTWVERVPDSGLIRRFPSSGGHIRDWGPYRVVKGLNGCLQPDEIHVEFQDENGQPWGQAHNIVIKIENVVRDRYTLIDLARDPAAVGSNASLRGREIWLRHRSKGFCAGFWPRLELPRGYLPSR